MGIEKQQKQQDCFEDQAQGNLKATQHLLCFQYDY